MTTENPTLLNLSSALLEHVIIKAGTSRLKGGGVPGGYLVHVGEGLDGFAIFGDDATDAMNKFLYWILTKKMERTKEELLQAAEKFLRKEEEEAALFIDRLTEGGMSEFGKKVQAYRRDRGAKIYQAIRDLRAQGDPPIRLDEWREAIRAKTGYEDIDPQEVLMGFADTQQLDQRPG